MKPISWYKSLSQPKFRRRYGYFLIEGRRAVEQILAFHRSSVEELLFVDGSGLPPTDIPARAISGANMKSVCASRAPQGIAALVRIPPDVYTPQVPDATGLPRADSRVLLLEHVQDPGNVGTLIRTAAAFGVAGVILSGQCADPFSPKTVQSTAGSLLSLWIRKTDEYLSVVDGLKNRGYKLFAADLDGSESLDFRPPAPHILALGSEGAGLTAGVINRCDRRVRIPIAESGAESLNVAASGAILMFLLSRGL